MSCYSPVISYMLHLPGYTFFLTWDRIFPSFEQTSEGCFMVGVVELGPMV